MKLTVMSPAYVVYRESPLDGQPGYMELTYYQSSYSSDVDENGNVHQFSPFKLGALIFQSLGTAARVARAETAMVRALTSPEEADEFGR